MTHRRLISTLLLLIFVSAASFRLHASGISEIVRDSVATFFRLNSPALDTAYSDNGHRLDSCFRALDSDAGMRITGVDVLGAASPEGADGLNDRLSHLRAESLLDYVGRLVALPDSVVTLTPAGRDWTGMRRLVASSPAFPGRQEVIDILDSYPPTFAADPAAESECMRRLMEADGGNAYAYLRENIFPMLRKATLVVEYDRPDIPRVPAQGASSAMLPVDMTVDCIGPMTYPPTPRGHRQLYMALKTNMLYDLAAVPQAAFEMYVGRGWSVAAGGMYAWWSNDSRHRYWRIYGGDLTVRRWLGKTARRRPLTGHHVGAYAGAVTFDFEWGKRGYMGGVPKGTLLDRCMFVGGVEYGYSLPVARRLNIDFTIGVGYLGGKYIKYDPVNGKYFEDSVVRLNYFGPTRAEVSLVWLIGHGDRWKF